MRSRVDRASGTVSRSRTGLLAAVAELKRAPVTDTRITSTGAVYPAAVPSDLATGVFTVVDGREAA
jgi:hypothetical protein